MAISIDGVVYSVSANTSKFEESMKKVESLEKKLADLTDKYNDKKIKSAVAIEDAEKKLAQSREQFAALQEATTKEEIAQRKQIERQIQSQEKALKKLQDKQVIAEADYQRELQKTQKQLEKVSSSIGKYDKALNSLSGAFSKITVPLTAIAGTSLYAWGQQEEALQRMESALKNSGLSVDQYSAKFQELASNIQKFTVVGDETILKNEQFALSMGVSVENMEWVQRGAVALQEALGINLTEATKKLAGALQGNMEPFNELIPEMRNASTESEKLAILNQKLADYWQVAKEKADTFNGALQQAKNAIGDAGEEIGKVLAPAIISLANSVKGLAKWFSGLSDTTKTLIVTLGSTAAALPLLSKAIIATRAAWTAYTVAVAAAKTGTDAFKAALVKTGIGAAIVALGYALSYVISKFDDWTSRGDEFQASTQQSTDDTFKFNAEIQNSKKALEDATKAVQAQNNALVAYHTALDELNKIKADRAFRDMTEAEQLKELSAQYENAQNRIKLLEADLQGQNLTLEHKAFIQEELVKWTKELYSVEDKQKALRQNINKQIDEQNKKLKEKQKKEQEAAKKEQEAAKKEQEAAQKERERVLQSRENYEYQLKLSVLAAQGNTELADKLKMEQRVAELMKEQQYSREEAYKFAKLEKELAGGKQVEYSEKDIAKAKRIVERGEGGTVGKKTLEQAQAILAGKEIRGKELSIFAGAGSRGTKLLDQANTAFGLSGKRISDSTNILTSRAATNIAKDNQAASQAVSPDKEILTKIYERLSGIEDIKTSINQYFNKQKSK